MQVSIIACEMSTGNMASHSRTLTWRIPWTEEPGGLHGVPESDTTGRVTHTRESAFLSGSFFGDFSFYHWSSEILPVHV